MSTTLGDALRFRAATAVQEAEDKQEREREERRQLIERNWPAYKELLTADLFKRAASGFFTMPVASMYFHLLGDNFPDDMRPVVNEFVREWARREGMTFQFIINDIPVLSW
jgi:hypothetical protein